MKLELNNDQMEVINIIQRYPDTLSNLKRFASILSDCIPENKALRNALVCAYEEGIIDVIQNGDNSQQTIFQCRKRLENNCGIASGYANSAVLIMAYICGKEEWFQIKDIKVDEAIQIKVEREKRCADFAVGAIEYYLADNRVVITNIKFARGGLRQSKTIVVIPEKLDGYEVSGIMPNALNNIRKEKCKMVMLPFTVKFVGTDYYKLYSDFKEKGVYVKPLLYLAQKSYESYSEFTYFYDKLTEIKQEEFFCFECDQEIIDVLEFIPLKKYQDKNDYWKYPDDGKWISTEGFLDKYMGKESHVVIDNCVGVSSDAFVGKNIEEIVFGASVSSFATGMIHN